jgi:hypothetical protein
MSVREHHKQHQVNRNCSHFIDATIARQGFRKPMLNGESFRNPFALRTDVYKSMNARQNLARQMQTIRIYNLQITTDGT